MKRFILLSFAVLGWAFYEMSGGADFEPGSVSFQSPLAQVESRQPEVVARGDTTAAELTVVARNVLPPETADTSSKLDLTLTAVSPVAVNKAALDPIKAEAVAPTTAIEPLVVDQSAIDAALASVLATDPETDALPIQLADDLREVTGNRVNLRDGPGTDFGVVTRLQRGDSVIVLDEPGNGWLRLQVVDSDRVGWMADFLVTASVD